MEEEPSVFGGADGFDGGSVFGTSPPRATASLGKQESFGVDALGTRCRKAGGSSTPASTPDRGSASQSQCPLAAQARASPQQRHIRLEKADKLSSSSDGGSPQPYGATPGNAEEHVGDGRGNGAKSQGSVAPTADTDSARSSTATPGNSSKAILGPLAPVMPADPSRKYNVKGAQKPQPVQRCQFRAVPTGNSDSDTDDDGSTSSSRSGSSAPELTRQYQDPTTAMTQEELDEEQQFVDEFGFVVDDEGRQRDEKYVRGINGKQVIRREIKWANMAADWDRTNGKLHDKLKERCRKGIPSRFRGVAWQLLLTSGPEMASPANAGVYLALRDKKLADSEVDAIISRDLSRTFPNHILFRDSDGVGQTFLRNVLHAYAGADPEVGYVQGMGFIVGALSTQMGEEEAFWALHQLMYNDRYRMRELFRPGFPLLHQFFYQFKRLLAKIVPKLSKRFEQLSVDPSFYASQWFLTLFVYHFPFRSLLRIWDVFFCEGWKIIFRTGLALLKWEEKRLLPLPFEELLPALKSIQDGKNTRELLRRAHRIKFKTVVLNRYGDEYWAALKAGTVPQ